MNSAAKIVGKKSSGKVQKKRFLYSHEYHYQTLRGKNSRNNISWKSRRVRAKIVGKKYSGKSAKKVFYINTNIVSKKWGVKNA